MFTYIILGALAAFLFIRWLQYIYHERNMLSAKELDALLLTKLNSGEKNEE